MPASAAFAFCPHLDAVTKPRVFQALDGLAQHIERLRHGQTIQLTEIDRLHLQWAEAGGPADVQPAKGRRDRGVRIDTLCLDGSPDRCLGFAWLDGMGRDALQRALSLVHAGSAAA